MEPLLIILIHYPTGLHFILRHHGTWEAPTAWIVQNGSEIKMQDGIEFEIEKGSIEKIAEVAYCRDLGIIVRGKYICYFAKNPGHNTVYPLLEFLINRTDANLSF